MIFVIAKKQEKNKKKINSKMSPKMIKKFNLFNKKKLNKLKRKL